MGCIHSRPLFTRKFCVTCGDDIPIHLQLKTNSHCEKIVCKGGDYMRRVQAQKGREMARFESYEFTFL
ncbi:uncharacterized protein H6S33_005708 [Morchella sextelata]|uniref:uncharacterized protein n=1 Tax=Morchella sextelata TaxID=1174677 RepID=UPI001D043DCB|nr:uncharacterized protein H6S33_005708 [Morchella sextelata]KAH0613822.1 hypothetical protein H6S33_005708 [Morchella sextelata]